MVVRVLAEQFGVSYHNRVVRFVAAITEPTLRIFRRFVPRLYGFDLAGVVAIWFLATLKIVLRLWGAGYQINWFGAVVVGFGDALNSVVWILLAAILVGVVLSWVAPRSQHPAVYLVLALSEPVMRPFRRLLPTPGGLDFSPLLALLAMNFIQKLLVAPILNFGYGLF